MCYRKRDVWVNLYAIRQALKTRPTLRLAGRVRTEIADCVTESYYREPVDNSVQLFYLGGVDFFGRRGLFEFRLDNSEPNQ